MQGRIPLSRQTLCVTLSLTPCTNYSTWLTASVCSQRRTRLPRLALCVHKSAHVQLFVKLHSRCPRCGVSLWLLPCARVSNTMRVHVYGKQVFCFKWTSLDVVVVTSTALLCVVLAVSAVHLHALSSSLLITLILLTRLIHVQCYIVSTSSCSVGYRVA